MERFRKLEDGRVLFEFRKTRFDGATHIVLTPLELLEKPAALVAPPHFHLVHYSGVFAPHAPDRSKVVPGDGGPQEGGRRVENSGGGGRSSGPDRPAPDRGGASSEPPPPASVAESVAESVAPPLAPAEGSREPRLQASERDECGDRHTRRRGDREGNGEEAEAASSRPRKVRRTRTDWASLLKRTLHVDALLCRRCGGRMTVLACIEEPALIRKILESMRLWEDPARIAPARPAPRVESDQQESG